MRSTRDALKIATSAAVSVGMVAATLYTLSNRDSTESLTQEYFIPAIPAALAGAIGSYYFNLSKSVSYSLRAAFSGLATATTTFSGAFLIGRGDVTFRRLENCMFFGAAGFFIGTPSAIIGHCLVEGGVKVKSLVFSDGEKIAEARPLLLDLSNEPDAAPLPLALATPLPESKAEQYSRRRSSVLQRGIFASNHSQLMQELKEGALVGLAAGTFAQVAVGFKEGPVGGLFGGVINKALSHAMHRKGFTKLDSEVAALFMTALMDVGGLHNFGRNKGAIIPYTDHIGTDHLVFYSALLVGLVGVAIYKKGAAPIMYLASEAAAPHDQKASVRRPR